jgi:hypothetical protein
MTSSCFGFPGELATGAVRGTRIIILRRGKLARKSIVNSWLTSNYLARHTFSNRATMVNATLFCSSAASDYDEL